MSHMPSNQGREKQKEKGKNREMKKQRVTFRKDNCRPWSPKTYTVSLNGEAVARMQQAGRDAWDDNWFAYGTTQTERFNTCGEGMPLEKLKAYLRELFADREVK